MLKARPPSTPTPHTHRDTNTDIDTTQTPQHNTSPNLSRTQIKTRKIYRGKNGEGRVLHMYAYI